MNVAGPQRITSSQGVAPCLLLPSLLDRDLTRRLAAATAGLRARRVRTGDHADEWEELSVDPDHELAAVLSSDRILGTVLTAVGQPASRAGDVRITLWANRYRTGECIPRHRDSSGAVQLVVCLEAPDPAGGGSLVLATEQGEVSLRLAPGDAVLFHRTIEHWTTRLVPSSQDPNPVRWVAVGRYHL